MSRPGNPYDNAVVESANRMPKRELVRGRAFASEEHLRTELFDWVSWYNNRRLHSTLGYMTPVGFREAGLILSWICPKRCCHIIPRPDGGGGGGVGPRPPPSRPGSPNILNGGQTKRDRTRIDF